jgi:type I restriction enzyme S subunit
MIKEWKSSTLGELASVSFSAVDKHILPGETEVYLCNYLDVYRNRRLTKDLPFARGSAKPGEIARFQLQRGDVIITKDSEEAEDIGVPAVVMDDLPGTICGYHLAIIRPSQAIDSQFLAYYLQSDPAKKHFLRTANGVTRFGLGLRAIDTLPLLLPPLSEQGAIAALLDAADTAIERTQAAVSRTRELDHALLHSLLKKGEASTRNGTRGQAAHWNLRCVDDLAQVGSGVTLGKDVSGFKSVELPYLRVANVQDGHLDLSEIKTVRVRVDEVPQFRLEPGDVLMTEGGDIDKLGRGTIWEGQILECLHQNHIFRIRANRDLLLPEFFALVVESDIAKRYFNRVAKRTTNLASTNKTQVRAFTFPLPPTLDEQRQIADIMKAAKAKTAALVEKEKALTELQKSLANDLLTGRVRVPDAVQA